MIYLYPFWCAALNYIRGRGWLPKLICYFLMALPLAFFANWIWGVVALIGFYIPSWAGWGKVMQAMIGHGDLNIVNNEPQFPPIDWLTNKIYGIATDMAGGRRKARLWGIIFGFLYLPMFIFMGTWYLGLLCTFFGIIAYINKDWWKFEIQWGFFIGILICISLLLKF